jgi:hypothetical protein
MNPSLATINGRPHCAAGKRSDTNTSPDASNVRKYVCDAPDVCRYAPEKLLYANAYNRETAGEVVLCAWAMLLLMLAVAEAMTQTRSANGTAGPIAPSQ